MPIKEFEGYLGAAERLFHELEGPAPREANTPSRPALALEIVMACLAEGMMPPAWAAKAAVAAYNAFDDFKHASLGAAFEIPDTKQVVARRRELQSALISYEVDLLNVDLPLVDSAGGDGAYTTVGKKYDMSAKTVEALRTSWRRECRKHGIDPKFTAPKFADPAPMIFKAIAQALAPRKLNDEQSPKKPRRK